MAKIKVVLAVPQLLFREGMHFIFSGEEDFEVAAEATANGEALKLIEANPPDILVLSQPDAGADGTETARRARRNFPSLSVVLVFDKKDDAQTFAAIKSGASAYFTKDIEPEGLVSIFKEVAGGGMPIVAALTTPALAAKTLVEFKDLAAINERLGIPMTFLAKKEIEILGYIAEGNGVGQVAARLNVTEETVRTHLRVIVQKLAANSQAQDVIEAAQKSLPSLVLNKSNGQNEYLTKAEFNEFKDSLVARFKSLVVELNELKGNLIARFKPLVDEKG